MATNPSAEESARKEAEGEAAIDYENLDLSFDDVDDDFVAGATESSLYPSCGSTPTVTSTDDHSSFSPNQHDSCLKKGTCQSDDENENEYILGTLILRVVAARDLESAQSGTTPLQQFFSSAASGATGRHASHKTNNKKSGSSNPYAMATFGKTTQRTVAVFDTVDPIWPRGESMYMDVTQTWKPTPMEKAGKEPTNTVPVVSKSETKADKSTTTASKSTMGDDKDVADTTVSNPQPKVNSLLTIAIFHSYDMDHHRYPTSTKDTQQHQHEDKFLGMASVDLTGLVTGKCDTLDEWLLLTGTTSDNHPAQVRIVAEYEPAQTPPLPGDYVRFTDYCHYSDIYPLSHNKLYRVVETMDYYSNNNPQVLLEWKTPEGWISTVSVHRHMLDCCSQDRPPTVADRCREELRSIQHNMAHAPLVRAVQTGVEQVPEEGLVGVGAHVVQGASFLVSKWFQAGWETAVEDVVVATNWDGRFNPREDDDSDNHDNDDNSENDNSADHAAQQQKLHSSTATSTTLPNMPSCPITGEPMLEPVVAADGHTYERTAIARWLQTSNKSPLTGSVLPHKDLVPNYMLLSSLQEAVAAASKGGDMKDNEVPETAAVLAVEENEARRITGEATRTAALNVKLAPSAAATPTPDSVVASISNDDIDEISTEDIDING